MKEHNLEAFYKYYSNATKEQAIEDMYLDNCKLEEENEYLRFIIKEVKKLVEQLKYETINASTRKKFLEILDKGIDKNEQF